MSDATARTEIDSPPVALTIAGSDSGGGAGIQADLLTFAAHGVFGTTALTAVTAQNTVGVHAVAVLDATLISAQIEAVICDFAVRAVKTGMLATGPVVDMVGSFARAGRLPHLVVDPVMIATTGARLLDADARDAYLALLPFAEIVTPNLPESEYLTGRRVCDRAGMEVAAQALVAAGARAVLVKGGHLSGVRAIDIFFDGDRLVVLEAEMIRTDNVHGTGCTLSAAIAANLASGDGLLVAVERAKHYVGACLGSSLRWELGRGAGPLDHSPPGR